MSPESWYNLLNRNHYCIMEIKKTDVPKAVTDSIMKGFAGFKIEEYAKVEKAGLVTYEAEIAGKKDGKKIEYIVIYSSDGKFIEKKELVEKT